MRTRRLLLILALAGTAVGGASSAAGATGDEQPVDEAVDVATVFEASAHRTERLPDGRVVRTTWEDDGTADGRWVDDGPSATAPAAAPVTARPTFAG